MRPFTYDRATDMTQAFRLGSETGQGQVDAPVQFLAGGTTLIDLMKLDVLRPLRVVDLNGVADTMQSVTTSATGLRLGAFCEDVECRPITQWYVRHYPVIAQSLFSCREPAASQHGNARRQCSAENPLLLLS